MRDKKTLRLPGVTMMCAGKLDGREKLLINPYRPIYKLHWTEIPNWTLREESLCGQMPRGHKRSGRQASLS